MQQTLFCLLFLVSLCFASFVDEHCENILNCNDCEASNHCGWCLNGDRMHGQCKTFTRNEDSCSEWLGGNKCFGLSPNHSFLEREFFPVCELFKQCDECLESELGCKYCPDMNKCVASSSLESCSVPFITQENENECPLTKQDAGSSLTPFACVIVLFSFLICLL